MFLVNSEKNTPFDMSWGTIKTRVNVLTCQCSNPGIVV